MNVVKKVISLITIVLVVIRLLVINASAAFTAPFVAEETLKIALIEGLTAGGADFVKDDLEAWELDELENEFEIQMTTNPNFKPKKAMPKIFPFIPFSDTVLAEFFTSIEENGAELYDFINPTYNTSIDMQGGVSVLYDRWGAVASQPNEKYYSVYYSSEPAEIFLNGNELWYFIKYDYWESHSPQGVTRHDEPNTRTGGLSSLKYERYGKWVWREDGTQAETDDEVIPVIGEADGTQVTPDMLNPDGTVTIDGTVYSPSDYIDWEKFKDNAIIDLLKQILDKIDSTPVAEPDTTKDLVDSITESVDISVSEELSDYMVPTGISSVFPFCLPFDLYRGIKLLSAKPVAPVLKIPFEVPEFGLFKGYKTELTIEFEKYDKYFSVFRWGTYLMFALGLIFITTKIVKGANE